MAPSWQRALSGPAIHALVIGVGAYPNVGSKSSNDFLRNLRALTSPPLSAVAVAQFLTTSVDLARRVASVDLLVSDGTAVPAGWATRTPTRANIEAAFAEWKERSPRSEDTLLFYFCGHGFQTSAVFVLPEDVGSNRTNPLVNAINLSRTQLAMSQATQRTQLWLADACREAPREATPEAH